MAKQSKTSTVAIQNLLEEKRQIERWLRRLDMAGDKTPAQVRKKVRSDYSRRLDAILEELQGYREELNASLLGHREVRDGLAKREADASESLAEAELRHTVGEYDADKWSGIRAEILESLVKIREELKASQAEITQLEEVLDAMDAPAPVEETEAVAVAGAESDGAAKPPEGAAPSDVPAVAELESEEEREAARPARKGRDTDEMAFLRSVISGDRSAEALAKGAKSGGGKAEGESRSRPSKGSAKKTVKCGDCGTLNLPTEWYCENCGAELTAL
jgi:hypothetical protein